MAIVFNQQGNFIPPCVKWRYSYTKHKKRPDTPIGGIFWPKIFPLLSAIKLPEWSSFFLRTMRQCSSSNFPIAEKCSLSSPYPELYSLGKISSLASRTRAMRRKILQQAENKCKTKSSTSISADYTSRICLTVKTRRRQVLAENL